MAKTQPSPKNGTRTDAPSTPTDNGTRTEPVPPQPEVTGYDDSMDPCPAGFLTRPMLLQRTGLKNSELRSLEGRGMVKAAKRNNRGWFLWPESIVPAIAKKQKAYASPDYAHEVVTYESNAAVYVFELLDEGVPLTEIVKRSKLHPAVVRAIMRDYDGLAETISIPKLILDKINFLPLDCPLPIKTAEDVLRAFEMLAAATVCARCKTKPKKLCTSCVRETVDAKLQRLLGSAEEARTEQSIDAAAYDERRSEPSAGPSSNPT